MTLSSWMSGTSGLLKPSAQLSCYKLCSIVLGKIPAISLFPDFYYLAFRSHCKETVAANG
jgi:hypothetical protein